ncbi:CoA pyrophosphatase [Brachybacterium sp. UMB0905]|uniref:NUDIX hydrolase n=1 Tax=Brachybacterium sp. UMB0905 TaxID=2069310 RepID=UPI001E502F8E|nr:CoA pyrophosphatase [Brachybacterium sp. UMB0905]
MRRAQPPVGPDTVPAYLHPLATRAARGEVLLDRAGAREQLPPARDVRRSAVLIHLAGESAAHAHLLLEERGHQLRSQPGQFALPGGGVEPDDHDVVHTALREAQEETGLDPSDAKVLGAFAPIPMPWRAQEVTPVLSWSPQIPTLGPHDPVEVERLVWAPLVGGASLTDPARHARGRLDGRDVGPVFDLPGDAFIWGFTAMILEQVLAGVGLEVVGGNVPLRDIPPGRRRR